ncbi:hypothetical protein DRQ25_18400 [Candidatus Fermentibacteria bacterium]|nr:MAG: hypothetical protein DRQ25_18400 [Candidatus Fermentibacteria bacterium]
MSDFRGSAKVPTQKVTPFKQVDNSGQRMADAVSGVTAAAKGQVETNARDFAEDAQGDAPLREANKASANLEQQVAESFGAPNYEAVTIMQDNSTISQQELDEKRDDIIRTTFKTVQEVEQAISLNKMSQKEGNAVVNRLYREQTSSFVGSLFRDEIAKGTSRVTGNPAGSPMKGVAMSAADKEKKAVEQATLKRTAEKEMGVQAIMQATEVDKQKAEGIYDRQKALEYHNAQLKTQSASQLKVGLSDSNLAYNNVAGNLQKAASMNNNTVSPDMINMSVNELSAQHRKIREQTKEQGGDITTLMTQQTAEMSRLTTLSNALSDAKYQETIATLNKNRAVNQLWETNPTLARIMVQSGESYDPTEWDPYKIAYHALVADPSLAKQLGITITPKFLRRAEFSGKNPNSKTGTYTPNEVLEIINLVNRSGDNAVIAMEGPSAAKDFNSGKVETKENQRGLMATASSMGGESAADMVSRAKATNGEAWVNTATDKNYPVSAQFAFSSVDAIADGAPGAIDLVVNTANTLTDPNSTLMSDYKEYGDDIGISFVGKSNQVAASLAYVDSPKVIQMQFDNVPENVRESDEFQAVANSLQDVYKGLVVNPSLWSYKYDTASQAMEAMMGGAKLDNTQAKKNALAYKNNSVDYRITKEGGEPRVIRPTPEGDTPVPKPDVRTPDGAIVTDEGDVGRVGPNTADKGTNLTDALS